MQQEMNIHRLNEIYLAVFQPLIYGLNGSVERFQLCMTWLMYADFGMFAEGAYRLLLFM